MKSCKCEFVQRNNDGTVKIYSGTRIILSLPGWTLPVYVVVASDGNPPITQPWFVSEWRTGCWLARGRTRQAAVDAAIGRLTRFGQAAYQRARVTIVRKFGPCNAKVQG